MKSPFIKPLQIQFQILNAAPESSMLKHFQAAIDATQRRNVQ
jgi:hypothetical protein